MTTTIRTIVATIVAIAGLTGPASAGDFVEKFGVVGDQMPASYVVGKFAIVADEKPRKVRSAFLRKFKCTPACAFTFRVAAGVVGIDTTAAGAESFEATGAVTVAPNEDFVSFMAAFTNAVNTNTTGPLKRP